MSSDPATGAVRYTNAQLTAEAVRRLTGDGFAIDDIACLSTGTSIADQLMPSHGVMVHGELGRHACEVITTTGVCVAGTAALKYAWLAVRAGEHPNAVATGSEIASVVFRSTRYAAETDRQVSELGERPELAFEKDFCAGCCRMAPAHSCSRISPIQPVRACGSTGWTFFPTRTKCRSACTRGRRRTPTAR